MEPLDALDRASLVFETRLRAVAMEQWHLPTPCEDWNVRQLAAHVVAGNQMAAQLLAGAGASQAAATLAGDALGSDPVGAFLSSAAEQTAAFAEPGAMETICHHPAGDISGALLLGFRVTDLTLHAWDLARAIKANDELDPELVEEIWRAMAPMAGMIGQTGFFGSGPSGLLGDEAPLQDRLLDLAGRRP